MFVSGRRRRRLGRDLLEKRKIGAPQFEVSTSVKRAPAHRRDPRDL